MNIDIKVKLINKLFKLLGKFGICNTKCVVCNSNLPRRYMVTYDGVLFKYPQVCCDGKCRLDLQTQWDGEMEEEYDSSYDTEPYGSMYPFSIEDYEYDRQAKLGAGSGYKNDGDDDVPF